MRNRNVLYTELHIVAFFYIKHIMLTRFSLNESINTYMLKSGVLFQKSISLVFQSKNIHMIDCFRCNN